MPQGSPCVIRIGSEGSCPPPAASASPSPSGTKPPAAASARLDAGEEALAALPVMDTLFEYPNAGRDAPGDPTKPDESSWKEAMLFAAITGLVVGAARVAAERKAAEYYLKSTGHLPGEKH